MPKLAQASKAPVSETKTTGCFRSVHHLSVGQTGASLLGPLDRTHTLATSPMAESTEEQYQRPHSLRSSSRSHSHQQERLTLELAKTSKGPVSRTITTRCARSVPHLSVGWYRPLGQQRRSPDYGQGALICPVLLTLTLCQPLS